MREKTGACVLFFLYLSRSMSASGTCLTSFEDLYIETRRGAKSGTCYCPPLDDST